MITSQNLTGAFKVGLFVDGFTLRKVNEYYRFRSPGCNGINLLGLKNWVAVQASRYFWPNRTIEMMAHYYHPYRNPEEEKDHRHRGVMYFSDELSKAGFDVHFASVNYARNLCPNMALKEDVLLYAQYKQLDAMILASTQGQFAGLPERLSHMDIPTLLLGWNFTYANYDREIHWHTDKELRRQSTYYIPMERVMDINKASNDVLARELFLTSKSKITACRGAFAGFARGMSRSA